MSTERNTVDDFLSRLNFLVQERLDGNWAGLARLSGLSRSSIHKIKTGSEPKLSSLEKISDALNVSLDWLSTGKGNVNRNEAANDAIDRMSLKMAEMFADLNDDQKRDVLSSVEEKNRLNTLEKTVSELQQKVG